MYAANQVELYQVELLFHRSILLPKRQQLIRSSSLHMIRNANDFHQPREMMLWDFRSTNKCRACQKYIHVVEIPDDFYTYLPAKTDLEKIQKPRNPAVFWSWHDSYLLPYTVWCKKLYICIYVILCSTIQVSLRPAISSLKLGSGSSRSLHNQPSSMKQPSSLEPKVQLHLPRTRDDSSDEEDSTHVDVKGIPGICM